MTKLRLLYVLLRHAHAALRNRKLSLNSHLHLSLISQLHGTTGMSTLDRVCLLLHRLQLNNFVVLHPHSSP